MKKVLFSLCLLMATVTMAAAQKTAESILSNYETITGLKSVDLSNDDLSMMMDVEITAQGNKMPMKMTLQGSNKFRIDMEAMGQKMLMVRNGDKGWMSMAGQIQPMPKEAIEAQGSQMNVVASLKFDKEKYNFDYQGAEDGMDKITVTPKVDTQKEGAKVVFFNDKGLMEKITGKMQGQDFEMVMKDYKKFGDITMPTVMDTKVAGNVVASIVINAFELDCPTAEWMFAEPTK